MAVKAGQGTYQTPTRKEDVLDLVTNVSPTDTQLVSGLGTSTAANTSHEWPEDTFAAAAANAKIEGDELTTTDQQGPSKGVNFTQILTKPYRVTRTEQKIGGYGTPNMMQYRKVKAAKELANDMEYALMRSSGVSGTSAAARSMKGVVAFITTNATAQTSGTCLTEVLFNDILEDTWVNSAMPADEVYTGIYLKRAISAFTAGSTKFTEVEDKRLVNAVDVYEADTTVVKLFKHRHIDTDMVIAIRNEVFKLAYLDRPFAETIAKTHDSEAAVMITELTLECRGEKTSAKRSGYFVG